MDKDTLEQKFKKWHNTDKKHTNNTKRNKQPAVKTNTASTQEPTNTDKYTRVGQKQIHIITTKTNFN